MLTEKQQAYLKRYEDRIEEVSDERDTQDGIWIYLKSGWLYLDELTIIHEDNFERVKKALRKTFLSSEKPKTLIVDRHLERIEVGQRVKLLLPQGEADTPTSNSGTVIEIHNQERGYPAGAWVYIKLDRIIRGYWHQRLGQMPDIEIYHYHVPYSPVHKAYVAEVLDPYSYPWYSGGKNGHKEIDYIEIIQEGKDGQEKEPQHPAA